MQPGMSFSGHYPKSLELENITDVIKQVLVNYDIRLRPNFGGEPLFIGMDLQIASFDAISEVNMPGLTSGNFIGFLKWDTPMRAVPLKVLPREDRCIC
ncbi:hypothetical protein CEXT_310361 [Caerostris extrusa]|uniref:Uncharacterized protein n=1 Tax=Caerostris extrusa TaxID=172846 RepID=A0AAV4V075_CAEEX|nr:hypothetical protein CEXT_310361 [Caerostris extrusa]